MGQMWRLLFFARLLSLPENNSVSNDTKGLMDLADSTDPLVVALLGSAGESHPLFQAPSAMRRMPTKQNSDIVPQVK